jgi:hypothetical protein
VTEPGQETNEMLVEQLSQQINRRRLTLPSLVFLEVTKPLSFIASQGLLLCQPFLGFLVQESLVADYAELLSNRANIEQLISHLEQEMAPQSESGKGED